ncbi:MAG: GreA/GreB family elongation factor [Clostridia bacterium]|nr:GreA/GreB family elongation factor [Clostridia bacterium]
MDSRVRFCGLGLSRSRASRGADALTRAAPFGRGNSPVGAGLIGHKVGETVEIRTPGGVMKFVIKGIKG